MAADGTGASRSTPGRILRFLSILGPGLTTGASDDDPSGIGTYAQAGAQLGYGMNWTLLFSYPLMAAIQEISARIGRTTGHGIAGNVRRHYPNWLLLGIVLLLFVADTINIGADLGAMADAVKLLIGGPPLVYVFAFGALSVAAETVLPYDRYAAVLRWLTLSLFAYVGAAFMADVRWGEALTGLFVPSLSLGGGFLTTLTAIFGTTISPYLFFWQAAQEGEELRARPDRQPLTERPEQAEGAIRRIRTDTLVGMALSNLIALAIMITAAASLHMHGVTDIQSSAQAAEALKPIAGEFAYALFSLGIVGTGLLAVPVLAGAAAYAIGEARKWPVGLARKPLQAKGFYAVLAASTALGAILNLTPVNPIRALYWTAVINGVIAVPVMVVMMLMTQRRDIMGDATVAGWLRGLGWASTAVMAAGAAGMAASWFG